MKRIKITITNRIYIQREYMSREYPHTKIEQKEAWKAITKKHSMPSMRGWDGGDEESAERLMWYDIELIE